MSSLMTIFIFIDLAALQDNTHYHLYGGMGQGGGVCGAGVDAGGGGLWSGASQAIIGRRPSPREKISP